MNTHIEIKVKEIKKNSRIKYIKFAVYAGYYNTLSENDPDYDPEGDNTIFIRTKILDTEKTYEAKTPNVQVVKDIKSEIDTVNTENLPLIFNYNSNIF